MVMENVNEAVRLLRQCNNCILVTHHQINELLDDIDNDDYCDECGELYPDDCVCEEEDYMDDDIDDYTIVSRSKLINNGRWVFEVVPPPLNAFARARWLNENH